MSTKMYGAKLPKSKAMDLALFIKNQITSNECFIKALGYDEKEVGFRQNIVAYLRIVEINKTHCFGSIVFHSIIS